MNSHDTVPRRGLVYTLINTIPTVLVLAAIAAVGWWGHKHEWTVPKFSTLTEGPTAEDDWCRDHNVPESECVECHPELLPPATARGWCTVHGIPECVLCNPELAQLKTVFSVSQTDWDRAKRALEFAPGRRTSRRVTCTSGGFNSPMTSP